MSETLDGRIWSALTNKGPKVITWTAMKGWYIATSLTTTVPVPEPSQVSGPITDAELEALITKPLDEELEALVTKSRGEEDET